MKQEKKIVLSASRRTDIPAFYMNDFMNSIRQGFFRTINPFNQKESLVDSSPDRVDTIVFWSKDYKRFIEGNFVQKLQKSGYHLFFNYTVNSEDSLLEPGISSLDQRLNQLEILSKMVSPRAIFWRFDPICYYNQPDGKICHNRHDFLKIADAASDLNIRYCITSFLDFYAKIGKRISGMPGFSFIDPPLDIKRKILFEMSQELKKRNIRLMICCEKKVMESMAPDSGIEPASCIPNHYLAELYGSDVSLQKDRGQRIKHGCGCKISVDIGSYRHHPCYHNCLFCYANPTGPKRDQKMKIDSVQIPKGAVLAPMAGITNLPHRLLAKAAGASLVCSEMVSANGLIRNNQKTIRLLKSHILEKPLSVQMFGADPSVMAEAAVMIESMGADIVDINFGCSVKKVIKTGAGVALMKNRGQAERILKTVRKAIFVPLTIKIRSGWDYSGIQALELAKMAESCGVNAIAVHPRTASQAFRGKADWSLISKIKQSVSIPVIGNGDINTWKDAVRMIQETGCDRVMIGRSAIGNLFLFTQIKAALSGETPPENSWHQQLSLLKKYLGYSVEYLGEKNAMFMMRSRLGWFAKGLPFNSRFRESIKNLATQSAALELIASYQKDIEKYFSEQKAFRHCENVP